MSFFTVEEIETQSYDTYQDGEYTVEILHMEKKSNFYDGTYIEIHRQFMDSEYEGKVWILKYKISSENKAIRHIARQTISKLAVNIAKLKPGEDLEPEHLIGKVTKIFIRNDKSKNGNNFSNIIREEPANKDDPVGIAGSGMQPFQANSLPSDVLNDQVPFL